MIVRDVEGAIQSYRPQQSVQGLFESKPNLERALVVTICNKGFAREWRRKYFRRLQALNQIHYGRPSEVIIKAWSELEPWQPLQTPSEGSFLLQSCSVYSLPDLMLQHVDSRTFQKSYLSRSAGRVSRTIEPRRPRKRNKLKSSMRNRGKSIASQHGTDIYECYKKVLEEYRNEKQRQRAALLVELKERYKMEQPFPDIREQVAGQWNEDKVSNPVTEMPVYSLSERSRVTDKLFTLPASSFEDKRPRHIDILTQSRRSQLSAVFTNLGLVNGFGQCVLRPAQARWDGRRVLGRSRFPVPVCRYLRPSRAMWDQRNVLCASAKRSSPMRIGLGHSTVLVT